MVATSDTRETMRSDNREVFIKKVVEIAQKKQKRLLFKLHPTKIMTAPLPKFALMRQPMPYCTKKAIPILW
jgi:hypothetical protein